MTKVVYEFTVPIEVLTPLHLGSGDFGRRSAVIDKEARSNQQPDVALIVRDASDRPYLPATSLKGVLRRLAEAVAPQPVVDELFGKSSDGSEAGSQIGAVLLRAARLVRPGDAIAAPYVARDTTGELGPGVFVAARTSIDPDRGIAGDALLFFQEMVAPGAVFGFRALVERTGKDAERRALASAEAFAAILKTACHPDGIAIGKGQADGFGRIRLVGTKMTVRRWALDARGAFVAGDAGHVWKDAVQPEETSSKVVRRKIWRLDCRGPYIVIDASRRAKRGERAEGDKTPQVRPQRLSGDLPLVMGSGISGALRSRATWLAGLNGLPKAQGATGVPTTPVERLFGTTGFRGLLSIEKIAVEKATPATVTSVNLDRFSGAPIDNKLFTTEVFTGVGLAVTITLTGRGKTDPTADDEALFDALCRDIEAEGLQLGHGGNKGFGWFVAKEIRDGRQ